MPERRIEMVHIQLTRGCNLRCWFCGQWGKKGFFADDSGTHLSYDEWKKVIDELAEYREKTGISPFVMIWGGEPLRTPFADEIIYYIKELGFSIGMVTNGTLIDKHEKMIRDCVDVLYVSIDGTPDIHNAIRGEGVFEQVSENLIKLAHKNVIIMSVVTKELVPKIPEFLDALEPLGIAELYLQDMIGFSGAEISDYKLWLKSAFDIDARYIDSWENNNLEIFDVSEFADTKHSFKISCKKHSANDDFCLSPFRHVHVAWNGNVLYCTDFYDFSAGNVKNEPLLDIFYNEKSEKFAKEIEEGHCVTCTQCSWRQKKDYLNG